MDVLHSSCWLGQQTVHTDTAWVAGSTICSCALQGALRERYGIAANTAHRALDDAIVLDQILPRLLQDGGTDLAELMKKSTASSGTWDMVNAPGNMLHMSCAAQYLRSKVVVIPCD